jgi:hypothetical protein
MPVSLIDTQRIADALLQKVDLNHAVSGLDCRTTYRSLSLCVLDSVFSIGVRYGQVLNLTERYCRRYGLGWPYQRKRYGLLPPTTEQDQILLSWGASARSSLSPSPPRCCTTDTGLRPGTES